MYIVTLILILVVSTLVAFKGFFKDKPPNKKEKLILIYFLLGGLSLKKP